MLAALAPSIAVGAACASTASAPNVPVDDDASAGDDAGALEDAGVASDGASCDPTVVDGASIGEPADGCADFHELPCGLPTTARLEGCFLDLATCVAQCGPSPVFYCQLAAVGCSPDAGILPASPTIVDCVRCGGASGRRPLGLRPSPASRASRAAKAGDLFASMAHLEAASVRAFRDLERWLGAHGAPARLARAARRAADDERRHARAATRLARRFGRVPARVRVDPVATPSLRALLEDDAIEGCVGETWGALLAAWQAARSEDPRVRRALARIARDEARHAALAWDVLRWGAPRLAPRDRAKVGRALARALANLASEEGNDGGAVSEDARRLAGLPSPAERRRLVTPLTKLVRDAARGSVMLPRPRAPRSRR